MINENGYIESFNSGYAKELAIDAKQLFSFLEITQEKSMKRLREIYKINYRPKVLANLDRELRTRGAIDVIKHGIKDYGVKLHLAYFNYPGCASY